MSGVEIWKKVPKRYGEYWVSSEGRIKSAHRILNPKPGSQGYIKVTLKVDGKYIGSSIHRLVALSFGLITEIDMVNHIDGVKHNNRLSNLEWADHSSNIKHAYATGLKKAHLGSKNQMSKLTESDANELLELYSSGLKIKHIAKIFDITTSLVSHIANGRYWPELQQKRAELGIAKRQSRSNKKAYEASLKGDLEHE